MKSFRQIKTNNGIENIISIGPIYTSSGNLMPAKAGYDAVILSLAIVLDAASASITLNNDTITPSPGIVLPKNEDGWMVGESHSFEVSDGNAWIVGTGVYIKQ